MYTYAERNPNPRWRIGYEIVSRRISAKEKADEVKKLKE